MVSQFHAPVNPALVAMVDTANRVTHPTLADCTRAMSDASFELTCEEAALLLLAVNEASLAGYNFSALELALVDVIRRQLVAGSEDSEVDDEAEPEHLEDGDDDLMSMEQTDDVEMTSWTPRTRSELGRLAKANNRRRRLGQNVKGYTTTPDAAPTLAERITGRRQP